MFEKCDSSSRQYKLMIALFSKFHCEIWAGICLNTGKHFFLEVWFQSQQKEHSSFLKTVLEIFKTAYCLRDWHVFMWWSVEILNIFKYFNFETDFLENENLSQKTGVLIFSWKHWKSIISIQNWHIRSQC